MRLHRKPRQRSGIRDDDGPLRCPGHLQFVRGYTCLVDNGECIGRIEAAHVRGGTDGGMAQKPGDEWTVPLCGFHHAEQHSIGEKTFQVRYGIDMKQAAMKLAAQSPALRRIRRET